MKSKKLNIFTLILSIFILILSFWAYKKYSYSLNVENSFRNYIDLSNADIKTFIGKNIIIKSKIEKEPFFISAKRKEKIVLEYFLVEEEKNSRVNKNKEASYFKAIPFKVKFNNLNIIVEPNDIDFTYIGNPISKEENTDKNVLIIKKYYEFKENNDIYIFGKLEDKAGNLSIVNPNIEKNILDQIFNPSPFIISNYDINTLINKAKNTKNSIFLISILLLLTALFFIITSLRNLFA